MPQLHTYLFFNGSCRQAMEFYQKHIGGELQMMTFAEEPSGQMPSQARNLIMHATLRRGDMMLMASDATPDQPITQGDYAFLCLSVESVDEAERLFRVLGDQGRVIMPLGETFWAKRFGMLADQFGIKWMINLESQA